MTTSDRNGLLHDQGGRFTEKPSTAPGPGAQLDAVQTAGSAPEAASEPRPSTWEMENLDGTISTVPAPWTPEAKGQAWIVLTRDKVPDDELNGQYEAMPPLVVGPWPSMAHAEAEMDVDSVWYMSLVGDGSSSDCVNEGWMCDDCLTSDDPGSFDMVADAEWMVPSLDMLEDNAETYAEAQDE